MTSGGKWHNLRKRRRTFGQWVCVVLGWAIMLWGVWGLAVAFARACETWAEWATR